MCRKLIVVNELVLGNRPLGFETFSLKGGLLEFTAKQLKDIIRSGKDEVYGLALSETNELVPDTDFFCTNWMVKSHINTLVPRYQSEDMLFNLFYIVIGTHKERDTDVYELLSSRYERVNFTEEKVKTLLEMGIISAGAKLENGKVVVAPLEKRKQESTAEPVKEATAADSKDTKEPEKAEKAATGK